MRVLFTYVVAAAIAMASSLPAVLRAQSPVQRTTLGTSVGIKSAGTVIGTAWHRDNTPVAHAQLRLRDVTSGQVKMGTQADASGRFTFLEVPAGSYLVELVNEDGAVRAIGQMFGTAPGETVATFIRLGADVPWYAGFFSNAAAVVLVSAASLGVTAVGNGGQPASARN